MLSNADFAFGNKSTALLLTYRRKVNVGNTSDMNEVVDQNEMQRRELQAQAVGLMFKCGYLIDDLVDLRETLLARVRVLEKVENEAIRQEILDR